jgi:hypothetical protein
MGRFLNLIQGNPSPQEPKIAEADLKESSPSFSPTNKNKRVGKKK